MSHDSPLENTHQPTPMPPRGKPRPWRHLMLGLLILVCGIAIGAASTTILTRHRTHGRVFRAMRHPEQAPALITERLREELGLSPEQAKQIQAIVTRRMTAIEELSAETRPRIEAQFNLMHQEIAKVLDQNQRREFRERMEKIERFRRHGPPGPPRGRPRRPPGFLPPDKGH